MKKFILFAFVAMLAMLAAALVELSGVQTFPVWLYGLTGGLALSLVIAGIITGDRA